MAKVRRRRVSWRWVDMGSGSAGTRAAPLMMDWLGRLTRQVDRRRRNSAVADERNSLRSFLRLHHISVTRARGIVALALAIKIEPRPMHVLSLRGENHGCPIGSSKVAIRMLWRAGLVQSDQRFPRYTGLCPTNRASMRRLPCEFPRADSLWPHVQAQWIHHRYSAKTAIGVDGAVRGHRCTQQPGRPRPEDRTQDRQAGALSRQCICRWQDQ